LVGKRQSRMEAEPRSSASSSDGTKTQKYNKVTTTLDLGFRDLCFTTGKGKTIVYIHETCNLGIRKTFSPLGVFTDIYLQPRSLISCASARAIYLTVCRLAC
jgi:hypothetical protein